MSRMTEFLAALVLMCAPWAIAQDAQRNPQVPEDALSTRQLIAWSGLQKPQPAPQPLPPKDTPIPQPDQHSDQQAAPPADPKTEQSPTESFTGKIVRNGGQYELKTGAKTYHLDGQEGLDRYENQSVRVFGKLDTGGDSIRIVKIDLLS